MADREGLNFAMVLDRQGGGREIDWDGVAQHAASSDLVWLHLDRKHPRAVKWLREESGLDALACQALLAEETRPRSQTMSAGMLVILRGVNLNPGAEPHDMISLRMWFDDRRIITLRSRRAMAAQDVREAITTGKGPRGVGDFLTEIAVRLIDRMAPAVDEVDEAVERLED